MSRLIKGLAQFRATPDLQSAYQRSGAGLLTIVVLLTVEKDTWFPVALPPKMLPTLMPPALRTGGKAGGYDNVMEL